jgi:serine/threonine-protein kinase RsbW
MLVVSELVTNAFLHGRGNIELRLRVQRPQRLVVEVVDEGRDAALEVREHDPQADGGWGLQIVDELALRWGAFEGTTHVWAELPLD